MRSKILNGCVLLGFFAWAFLMLGYHPGVEDDTSYLAAIKHRLDPSLFPHDAAFITEQLQGTAFVPLLAASVRVLHLPVASVCLLWQGAGLLLFVLACSLLLSRCFAEPWARLVGMASLVTMLTVPVAETNLFLVDQHLHPRLLCTDAILFALLAVLSARPILAVTSLALGAAVHPLMAAFGVSLAAALWFEPRWLPILRPLRGALPGRAAAARTAAVVLPGSWLWERPNPAWEEATLPRHSLFVSQWHWYGWAGIVLPLAALFAVRQWAAGRGLLTVCRLCNALLFFSGLQLLLALLLLQPGVPLNFLQFEPMRFLHIVYMCTLLLAGGAVGSLLGPRRAWRAALVLLPLSAVMVSVQLGEFRGSPHWEWPWNARQPDANSYPWLAAFAWVRANTPSDAYFALDPRYTELPEEGTHSFRALAERSALADADKDAGIVTHVAHLGPTWLAQTGARAGWRHFQLADFERLRTRFGVGWVLVSPPQAAHLPCPYTNATVSVCRLP